MSFLVKKDIGIIPIDYRSKISKRYKLVSRAINQKFWNSSSDESHSFYVGSYGRGTAINTSDIDILVEIPQFEWCHYGYLNGNAQSRFLQIVKSSIQSVYPRSDIRADGQVIKINFSDGIYFEILPAFKKQNYKYIYPDTNLGGNWRSTNPKAEQEAMKKKDANSNGLLRATCRNFRYIRDNYFSSYHLSGIVIDSFVYEVIGNWRFISSGESGSTSSGDYEKMLQDELTTRSMFGMLTLTTPGSNQRIEASNSLDCLKKVVNKMVE